MQTTMKAKNLFGFFAAVLTFVLLLPAVSAFADIDYVRAESSYDLIGGENIALFADNTLNLRVVFTSDAIISDGVEENVRVNARILGEPGISDMTERFDVLEGGRTYSKFLTLNLPNDIDPEETFVLEVTVESNSEEADTKQFNLQIQRNSYTLEILSVETDSSANAGETIAIDVVVKNRGRQESEDTFVEASIPELGVSKRIFLGDLSAVDQNDPDKFDSAQGRIYLNIPSNAQVGLYNIEIEAFNDDTETTVTKRLEIGSASSMSGVISSLTTKNFASGEEVTYTFSIVNSGQGIRVYTLIPEVDDGLTVDLDETVVAVPAGTSKTVKLTALAERDGNYNFNVNVHASDGELVGVQEFVAEVEGKASVATGSTAVVLTIVLAIIFVVLLIVLIVLLTRKPAQSEEFGESYY
jgi:hypothetical protein